MGAMQALNPSGILDAPAIPRVNTGGFACSSGRTMASCSAQRHDRMLAAGFVSAAAVSACPCATRVIFARRKDSFYVKREEGKASMSSSSRVHNTSSFLGTPSASWLAFAAPRNYPRVHLLFQMRTRRGLHVECTSQAAPGGPAGGALGGFPADVPPEVWKDFLRGGDQVTAVLQSMADLLEGISGLDEAGEMALRLAAAGAVKGKVDTLDQSFILALDYMIKDAKAKEDLKTEILLEVVKEQVLEQLSLTLPNEAQVVSMLVSTREKSARKEVLCRAAGGGGSLQTDDGGEAHIPKASMEQIARQADTFILAMEEQGQVADRQLLSRLVLVREEARSLLGGGILDERNNTRALKCLPEPEVNFLSRLVQMKAGPLQRQRIAEVMQGQMEGEDLPMPPPGDAPEKRDRFQGSLRVKRAKKAKLLPVRPGMFLETVNKVLGGVYKQGGAGLTVQQLECIRKEVLDVLQEIAHPPEDKSTKL